MMKQRLKLFLVAISALLLTSVNAFAQNNSVGIGTLNPDNSAILELQSSNQGFLVPRLDSTQITNLNSPADGLLLYNNQDKCFWYHKFNAWKRICDTDSLVANYISADTAFLNNIIANYLQADTIIANYIQTNYLIADTAIINNLIANLIQTDTIIANYVQTNLFYGDSVFANYLMAVSIFINGTSIFNIIQDSITNMAWLLNGNLNTNPTTNFIGTRDNQHLQIRTNNQNRLRVTNDGRVAIGTITPNNSAILQLDATNRGFLMPRVTSAQRLAIAAPAIGLQLYDTDRKAPCYWTGTTWECQTYWHVTGNSNVDSTNYIGTNIDVPFVVKVNNIRSGLISNDAILIGINAGRFINPNNINQASFISRNIAIGREALFNLQPNYLTPVAIYNIAIGQDSQRSAIFTSRNTTIGHSTLQFNVTGQDVIAIGVNTLQLTTDVNTTVAIGNYSQSQAGSGSDRNVSVGHRSLFNVSNGKGIVAIGHEAVFQNTTGSSVVGIGEGSLYFNQTGSSLTFVGQGSGVSFANNNLINSSAFGSGTIVTASNQVRIGNNTVSSIGGQVGWTTLSDGRFKTNIKSDVPGLDFINKLNPVTYNLNLNELTNFLYDDSLKSQSLYKDWINSQGFYISKTEKEKTIYTGFIAQEVEKAAKETGFNFSGVDAPKNQNDYYGLRYAEFTVPLVKAVQELSQQNLELKAAIEQLKKEINDLKNK
ncbi:MAG: tail fiber domain-containing protein [Bacteroidia bacterium]